MTGNSTATFDRQLDKALRKCVQCGACQAVCPVYGLGHEEGQCARGKLQLARAWRDGLVESSSELAAVFGQCGLCGRCAGACSNGVQSTTLFKTVRAELAKAGAGNALVQKSVGKVFASPGLLRTGLTLGSTATSLAARMIPRDSGLWLRMPLLKGLDRIAPQGVSPLIKDKAIEARGPAGAPRLALFTGCMANLLSHQLIRKAVDVFSRKYTVIVPAGQGCCGLPASSAGDVDAAERLARRNLDIMLAQEADVVTTVCASCTFGLRDGFDRLGAGELAAKVRDGVELLADMPGDARAAIPGQKVDLHVSCHLGGAGQTGLKNALHSVLDNAGLQVSHVTERCCGGGGLLPVNAPSLSDRLARAAEKEFSDNPAHTVVTGCSGCRIQWMRHASEEVRVVHPLELLM